MNKIWIVTQESNVDGEILFNVTPCATEEVAKKVFEQLKKETLSNGHFRDYEELLGTDEEYKVYEGNEDEFYIDDTYDDYYELVRVYEKEIWK
jgi:hypothetical protein